MTIPSYTEYKKDEFLRVLIGHIQANPNLDNKNLAESFFLYDNISFYTLKDIDSTIRSKYVIDDKVEKVIQEIDEIKIKKESTPVSAVSTHSNNVSYKKTYYNNPSLKNAPDAYDLATY